MLSARLVPGSTTAGSDGGYAERTVASAVGAQVIPDGLDARQAIAALHDGCMGVSRVEKAGLGVGDTALVTAASGAIGTWLIPLLKAGGVTVVAAARGERKLALAAERGADLVADYGEDGWAAGLHREVDAVFDGAGGAVGATAFGLLQRGGRFFSYGAAGGDFPAVEALAAERDVEVIGLHGQFTADDMHRAAAVALRRLADGTIHAVIGQAVPLEQAAEAHAAIAERRVAGKTLLLPQ